MEDPFLTFETTSKSKPMVRDSNNFTYVANASSTEVKYWNVRLKCAQLEFEPEFLPQTYERIANIVLQYNTLPNRRVPKPDSS